MFLGGREQIQLWSVNASLLALSVEHFPPLLCLAFTPAPEWMSEQLPVIASGHQDGTIRWWCVREPQGCGFALGHSREHEVPRAPVDHGAKSHALISAARESAAMLTAAAHGPMNDFAFLAPASCHFSSHGLGLHARVRLAERQAVCAYPEWMGCPPTLPPGGYGECALPLSTRLAPR